MTLIEYRTYIYSCPKIILNIFLNSLTPSSEKRNNHKGKKELKTIESSHFGLKPPILNARTTIKRQWCIYITSHKCVSTNLNHPQPEEILLSTLQPNAATFPTAKKKKDWEWYVRRKGTPTWYTSLPPNARPATLRKCFPHFISWTKIILMSWTMVLYPSRSLLVI